MFSTSMLGRWLTATPQHASLVAATIAGALSLPVLGWRRRTSMRHLPGGWDPALPRLRDVKHEFEVEMARARRYERPCSAIVVRPTGPVAESFRAPSGSGAGGEWPPDEQPAAAAAAVLRQTIRAIDLLSVAPAEHAVVLLLPETDRPKAARAAVRFADILQLRSGLGVEIGIATFPNDALILDDLLAAASSACRPARGTLAEIQPFPSPRMTQRSTSWEA